MLEEGDLVLCTVDRIVGTTVFIKTDLGEEGTIVTSEIAPGRIRNLRDYVVPNKKIVCKVLGAEKGNLHLSLRRVTGKEKKEVMEKYDQEKTATSILKTVLKEKVSEVVRKIKKKGILADFLKSCKENPKLLEEFMTSEEAAKICKILSEKKESIKQAKREFKLTSSEPDGIKIIKKILSSCECEIIYLGAGKYYLTASSSNYKEIDKKLEQELEKIKASAKSAKADFEIIEKKK